jgi:hypothetical protein
MAKDLQSDDKSKREAAQKKLEDLQKQANAQQPKKELSPEEKKKLAEIAKDLASKDPEKQKKAGEEFGDTKLAKDLAEGLKRQAEDLKDQATKPDGKPDPQKGMEAAKNMAELAKQLDDLKSGDPKKAEEAMRNLKDLAEKMKKNNPQHGDGSTSDAVGRGNIGNTNDNTGQPLKANEEFGKLTSELQLEKFKRAKDDPELLKKLGFNQQDFDRFLKGFEELAKQERAEKDQAAKRPDGPQPNVPKVNVGEATNKVESRGDGTAGNPQSSGSAPPVPGYQDARKKFAENAGKAKREEKK